MRIVFFGATNLGHRCCERLFELGEEVVGILSIPEEFKISYSAAPVRNVNYRGFELLALKHGVPLVYASGSAPEEYLETLRSWKPDLGIVVGWYYLIPAAVRQLFPLGVTAIHASLLPRYRGNAPLVWAIINGERETGVTLFYLDKEVDAGDIIAQRSFPIGVADSIKSVSENATTVALEILTEAVPLLRTGRAPRTPQDHSLATQFPARRPEDGLIDWDQSPESLRNFIRAQTRPYPGAFTIINGKKVIIWDAEIYEADTEK
jgi:methionyl-tRNA formyltransferase